MSRRIDIELTSARDDGSWTWRAAGAKAPKGTVAAAVLPSETKVGDVLRVEAEFFLDGIEITSVLPTKAARQEPERLEVIGPARSDEPLVTTTLASRGRDERGPRREGGRRDGPRREGDDRDRRPRAATTREPGAREVQRRPRPEGARRDRPRAEGAPSADQRPSTRRDGGDRPPRRNRPAPPPMPAVERPKAKRLRAGRAHRNALLESLPEDQRPIAEQVVLGGLPAVRQAIEKQNAERSAAGEQPIGSGPLLEVAEKLVPKVRAAEWRDRAEAALRDLDQLDLRDLRSVVSAADTRTKDPEARDLAAQLQSGLLRRVDVEHAAWLEELTATLDVGRIVRALRVSSRPPKAGTPLPPELSARLTQMAGEALTSDAPPERWVAVLEALAFAPVRDKVIPASLPTELHADVRSLIARLGNRIPKVAHIFEIEPDPAAPRPKTERRRPPKPKAKKPAAKVGPKPGAEPLSGAPAEGPASADAPAAAPAQPEAEAPSGAAAPAAPAQPEAEAPSGAAAPAAPAQPEAEAPSGAAAPEAPAQAPAADAADAADADGVAPEAPTTGPGIEDQQSAADPPPAPLLDDVWVAESSLEEPPGRS